MEPKSAHWKTHISKTHTHKHDPTELWQTLTTAHANGWEWDDVREMPESKHVHLPTAHTHTHKIFKKFEDMMMSQATKQLTCE